MSSMLRLELSEFSISFSNSLAKSVRVFTGESHRCCN